MARLVDSLTSLARHDVVVTGEIPLSAFQTLKIPEFVPVV